MANCADNLRQVLEGYEQERIQLSLKFLNQALVAATLNDNHECIAKLIKMGARNIDECIQLAKKKRFVNATAMLLLMRAALTGDETCLNLPHVSLYDIVQRNREQILSHELQREGDSLEHSFLREVVLTMQCGGRLSTFDAVVVAQQNGRYCICRKLMMFTGTNRHEGCVNWSKLSLASIDAQLLEMCTWITDLDLSANKLSIIPSGIGILSMMTNANFSSNDLTNVPASLLQLCKLEKLNLSHNKINDLPDIPYWSASLSMVDLSDNHLSSLPMTIGASGLNSLNLSNNRFNTVPLCICTFTTLKSLDLSENSNIRSLPCELGMLTKLEELNLNGLKRLKEPPKALTSSPQQCVTYLRDRLSRYDDSLPSIPLIIVGNPGSGKHALVSRLQNKQLTSLECNLRIYINEWECRPSITKRAVHFRTWLFNSLEDYKSFTHNCFFLQRSLYLLLFDMTKSESEGVHDVKVWLENITCKAPYSSVMIIGTHNTTVRSHQDHCNDDFLIQQAKMVASVYEHRLETIGFFQIGLKHRLEAVSRQLLDNIYSYAVNYPLLQLERAVIREIGIDGDRVEELLNHGKGKFDDKFLNQALEFATQMDSASNVGKVVLVCPWPSNINLKQCIMLAEREEKHHAHAMLLLVTTALSGVMEILHQISFEPAEEHRNAAVVHCYNDLFSVNVSTRVPIEIAQQSNQNQVMNKLLMMTDVYPDEGNICWEGLQLQKLDLSLLMKIYWVQNLILSRNKLTTLPQEISEYLQQVVKIDLQYNNLAIVPKCLLELPSLGELNLAHNKLQELPEVPKWSPNLKVLDLSNNQLSSLPLNVIAPAIHSLNIANNKFHAVPLCICSFATLHTLILSGNSNIVALPLEMGRLWCLSHLNLDGLKNLKEPPKEFQRECHDCIDYLKSKLRCGITHYRMKLMILGCANRGKTTLVAQLLGKEYDDESTPGVDISDWQYSPSIGRRVFHFSIWDFAGEEEYYATYRCFLSHNTLYLLLFNLKHGDKGVEELRPWLSDLAFRAPASRVIIIGTHLDEIPDEERGETDELLQRVGILAASYNRTLQIMEVLPVGLKNHIENIGLLKEAIYNHAAGYKNRGGRLIMGQTIPASYHVLDKQLETVQQEVRQGIREPIMHVEEFKVMVKQMNLLDIQDDTELRTVTLFLTDVGSLLHFDDRGHNLNELYFVDPRWLYDMMSKLITITEGSPFVKNGILYSKDISMLFNYKRFPWKYLEQYLALLDRFEIALSLDSGRILIPSMLPDKRPMEFKDVKSDKKEPTYSRFIIFSSIIVPPGLWSRLISRIMHSVKKVCNAMNKFIQDLFAVSTSTITGNSNQLAFTSADDPHLDYWRTGLCFEDEEVIFRIESLQTSEQFHRETENVPGVLVTVTGSNVGKKIIGQLIDLVMSLLIEWYPHLMPKRKYYYPVQKIPCLECINIGRVKPFEFSVDYCLHIISKNESIMIKCGYFCDVPGKNHLVSMADIVPDLLLQDIDSKFILKAEEIQYHGENSLLLGRGGFGQVFKGMCNEVSVAIKKFSNYVLSDEEAIIELRGEAMILQQICHPCIVRLIGVCVQPLCALILEEAPLRSLEFPLVRKKIPIHRLTTFRIATEVASGLCYMHNQGIIKRDAKASNILLWTLDPDSLCHYKLCDFGISAHLSPIGIRGHQGTKGFIAPEVIYRSKRKQPSVYDHRADIFSFGMFLYQLITRRYPYHNCPPDKIDEAVIVGHRPKLKDVYNSRTCFHYLTQIMKMCWEDNPKNRPDTTTIIDKFCQSATQTVMCVKPINTKRLMSKAIAIIPSDFAKAGHFNRLQSELWVFYDIDELGTEVCMFDVPTMLEINRTFIKGNHNIKCVALYGDHVCLGSRPVHNPMANCRLEVISISYRELTHSCRVHKGRSITCITSTDKAIYMGTLEGYCFLYSNINEIQTNVKPRCKCISEYPIEGIICTKQHVWVSFARRISLLNCNNLSIEYCVSRETGQEAYIGQLSLNSDTNIVWSSHLGGITLSAWDACNRCHMYDVDTGSHLKRVADSINDADNVMTAMTPALDTVWVGMATGHIMIFHKEELLSWFHPYKGCVRFLTLFPSPGPCEMEKAMVTSGGEQFRPLVEGLDKGDSEPSNSSESGTIIIWEAYEARTIKQITLIERNAPNHLSDYSTVCQIIKEDGFRDGTHLISPNSEEDNLPTVSEVSFKESDLKNPSPILPSSDHGDYDTDDKTSSPIVLEGELIPPQSPSVTDELNGETFNISLLDSKQIILIQCSKPVTLKSLYDKIQVTVAQDDYYLVYYRDEEAYELQTQENLDEYLKLPDKPQLCVVKMEIVSPKIHHATERSSEEEISMRIMGQIEQNLKLTCPKPAQLDALINEMSSLESLRNQKFNLVCPVTSSSNSSEMEVTIQEDFDKYLVMSNRPPLLVKMEQNTDSLSTTEDTELACTVSSSSNAQLNIAMESIESDATDDVTLHFKLFDSEHTLDVACTKPLRLEAVLNDLKLIANLEDQDWQLVYSVDESCIKIETQEDFDKYLSMDSASTPTLWITGVGT